MKKVSVLIIIIGLFIVSYPFLERGYTWYWQEKMLTEWEEETVNEDNGSDTIIEDNYDELHRVFEEELASDLAIEVEEEPAAAEEPEPAPPPQIRPKTLGVIKIDKINVKMPILEGTNQSSLKIGAGQMKGSTPLGEIGNAVLAGHRSYTYGRFFNRLNELEEGDLIIVEAQGQTYQYKVFRILVVEPTDLSVLNRNNRDRVLTLITCTPIRTATHRLIVHAVIE
jgi:sortase A